MAEYGSAQADADAMLTLLRAQPITVFPPEGGGLSTVPAGATPPYVSVHFVTEPIPGGRNDQRYTRTRTRAYAHCVGQNDIAARGLLDYVQAAWLDVRPVIPGRTCNPIQPDGAPREAQPTEPVAQTTVTITAVYRLETGPGVDGS